MSSELGYYIESDLTDNYSVGLSDDFEIVFMDLDNLETIAKYQIEKDEIFESDWCDFELISEKYIVQHSYNGKNMHRHHLNRMVGDQLWKLNKETFTAEVIYEVKGSNRILYACDEYLVLYNANENACQWIDYESNIIESQQKINLNLSFRHRYKCIYKEEQMVLEFKEYPTFPFNTKEQDIVVIDLEENGYDTF
jgi:hypothetical protein